MTVWNDHFVGRPEPTDLPEVTLRIDAAIKAIERVLQTGHSLPAVGTMLRRLREIRAEVDGAVRRGATDLRNAGPPVPQGPRPTNPGATTDPYPYPNS